MPKKNFKKSIWLFLPFAVTAAFFLWLYAGALSPARSAVFNTLALPAAFINGSPISVKDYEFRLNLAQNLNKGGTDGSEAGLDGTVFEKMLSDKKYEQVAKNYGVRISKNEIENAYQQRQKQMGDEYGNSFEKTLKASGLDAQMFKKYILSHELLMDKLLLWYNSSPKLSQKAFESATDLLNRAKAGEDMGMLARKYSQDETGSATKGDMGFVDPLALLPEIGEAVSGMQTGEYKIIPSRAGIHIVFLEEKNGNLVHLRQMFIKSQGFESWLKNETNKISSIIIYRP